LNGAQITNTDLENPDFCLFGMVNYTEYSPENYLTQINGNFGNPQQITGDAANPLLPNNLLPQCCIPSAVNLSVIPGSYNLQAQYFFGTEINGTQGPSNPWCLDFEDNEPQ